MIEPGSHTPYQHSFRVISTVKRNLEQHALEDYRNLTLSFEGGSVYQMCLANDKTGIKAAVQIWSNDALFVVLKDPKNGLVANILRDYSMVEIGQTDVLKVFVTIEPDASEETIQEAVNDLTSLFVDCLLPRLYKKEGQADSCQTCPNQLTCLARTPG